MEKTLLRTTNDNTDVKEKTATSENENIALSDLMHQMQKHLEDAQKDLIQPRNEVVEKLLKKVLH